MRLHVDAVSPESLAAKAGSRPGVTLRGVDVLNSCQYLDTNMGRRSTIKKDVIAEPAERRRYDSRVRRAQVDETRARILAAGSELAHRASRWDWSDLTARTIAAQAGVSERTVYRHFSTERQLHEALMRRLEQEAGVSYEEVRIDDLPAAASRLFATLPSFAVPPIFVQRDPTFVASGQRRCDAIVRALGEVTHTWPEAERHMAAAVLDLLWTPFSYERLVANWGFDAAGATRAVTWAMEVFITAIRDGSRPLPEAKLPQKRKRQSPTPRSN
jgi:AcrR family transcriptional regulator